MALKVHLKVLNVLNFETIWNFLFSNCYYGCEHCIGYVQMTSYLGGCLGGGGGVAGGA